MNCLHIRFLALSLGLYRIRSKFWQSCGLRSCINENTCNLYKSETFKMLFLLNRIKYSENLNRGASTTLQYNCLAGGHITYNNVDTSYAVPSTRRASSSSWLANGNYNDTEICCKARHCMWHAKKPASRVCAKRVEIKSGLLPPCRYCLFLHLLRANYTWKQSRSVAYPTLPSVYGYRWWRQAGYSLDVRVRAWQIY